jgi:hypothetical protein
VARGQRDGSLRPYSGLSRPEPLLFLPSSSSIVGRSFGRCLRNRMLSGSSMRFTVLLLNTLPHATVYMFLHNLLNVIVI